MEGIEIEIFGHSNYGSQRIIRVPTMAHLFANWIIITKFLGKRLVYYEGKAVVSGNIFRPSSTLGELNVVYIQVIEFNTYIGGSDRG